MLDLLYAQAAATRRRWYERHPEARRRLRRPAISVGNLSVGGTGKTPLVAMVARWLLAQGERPAILSRGYARRQREAGVVVVSDGQTILADLDRAGDEPLMLARDVAPAIVAVCEDRYLAGVLAERTLGATAHVLDDGFQHLPLARDLDILVTSPGEIPNGRALPRGRLREGASAAARADVVVVIGAHMAAARTEAWALGVSQAIGARRVLDLPTRSPSFAIAGIGNPQQFFDGLREAGADVRGTRAFRDHHRYAPADVLAIEAEVRSSGAEVVLTTAKDAVRLEPLSTLPFSLAIVPLSLDLDPPDALDAALRTALARAREAGSTHGSGTWGPGAA